MCNRGHQGKSAMDLQDACRAASEAAARSDAKIRTKLVERARKQGMTEAEGIELAEAWKRAARPTKHLHLGHDPVERHGSDEEREMLVRRRDAWLAEERVMAAVDRPPMAWRSRGGAQCAGRRPHAPDRRSLRWPCCLG